MKRRCIIITITCSSPKEAGKITEDLLQKRLIACANTMADVRSRFWWNGKLDEACEVLVICKTVAGNFSAVSDAVRKIHSYKVPEIIAIPITGGAISYLDWIRESVDRYPAFNSTQKRKRRLLNGDN